MYKAIEFLRYVLTTTLVGFWMSYEALKNALGDKDEQE